MYTDTNFNNKTILITGGAGFIGSNIAFYLQQHYPDARVIIFDCFRSGEELENGHLKSFGHYKNLRQFKGEIICGDLNSQADLDKLDAYNFDYIYHQAAISDTRAYNQDLVMRTNVNSFYKLLNLAKKKGASMVYASSGATYGNLSSPQSVGTEHPENPYGFSKYAMDQIAYRYINEFPHMHVVGLRYFNVYGPREYYKGSTASMVVQLGHQILAGQAPRLFEGSDQILRDFIHVEDVLQAIFKASDSEYSGVYNVGTGKPRSFQDIADILQSELGTNLGTEYFENPYEGYQAHTQADISQTTEDLGFLPAITLEEGIRSYIPEIKRIFAEEKPNARKL